jgi:hypothetical protein
MDKYEQILEEMQAMFGILPHPEREPKRALFYLKLYKYLKTK